MFTPSIQIQDLQEYKRLLDAVLNASQCTPLNETADQMEKSLRLL